MYPARALAVGGRSRRGRRRGARPGDVRGELRDDPRRRRELARARRRRPATVTSGIPTPPTSGAPRSSKASRPPRRAQHDIDRGARARVARRQRHHRPHLARGRDPARQSGRQLVAGARRRTARLQLVRLAPRQPRSDGAGHVRQRAAAQPARRPAPKAASPCTCPTARATTIYDAAMQYASEGSPLVVLAGKEYGSGSSRDWAAKGSQLLGVRAVLVESFERIHRSNLVGMGVLPLEFVDGATVATLGLTGQETYRVVGLEALAETARSRARSRCTPTTSSSRCAPASTRRSSSRSSSKAASCRSRCAGSSDRRADFRRAAGRRRWPRCPTPSGTRRRRARARQGRRRTWATRVVCRALIARTRVRPDTGRRRSRGGRCRRPRSAGSRIAPDVEAFGLLVGALDEEAVFAGADEEVGRDLDRAPFEEHLEPAFLAAAHAVEDRDQRADHARRRARSCRPRCLRRRNRTRCACARRRSRPDRTATSGCRHCGSSVR